MDTRSRQNTRYRASGKRDLLTTFPDGKHRIKGTTDIAIVQSPYVWMAIE